MTKKILMVGWGFPPDIDGGLDVHVSELFKHLRGKSEIDVDLVLPEERAPELENVIPVETGAGDMVHKARDLSKKAAQIASKYDIIHTHDWIGAESGLKSKKYSNTSWITTFHSISSSRSRKRSLRIERMEKAAAEKSDKVLSVSKVLKRDVKEKFGRESEVVYNGFEKPAEKGTDIKKKLGIDEEMIFYVGRHAEQKNIELLLRAFKKLNKGKLVLGGEGHMKEALEDFADLLDIRDSVEFVGFIPDSYLGDYYSSADVFVSPSRNEPFGLTIAEAACCGTPVVSTESGVHEVLPERAYYRCEKNSDSMKRNIDHALRSEDVSVEERGWETVSEEILEHYEEIISTSSTSP